MLAHYIGAIAGLAAAGGALLGAFLTSVLLLVRVSARWGGIEADLRNMVIRLDALVADKDAVHARLIGMIDSVSNRLWELHTEIQHTKGR